MRKDSFIVGEGVEISLNSHQTWLNNNILIVGASGSGKSRTIVEPNLYHSEGSYIISDPKGALYKRFSGLFRLKGYDVQKLDLIHPSEGSHYNPLAFIESDRDVLKIATILNGDNDSFSKDPFWDNAASLILISMIYYLREEYPKAKQTIPNVLKCLELCNKTENARPSRMDVLMSDLALRNPKSDAVRYYRKVECAAKTYNCVLLTLQTKLGILDSSSVSEMLNHSDIVFKELSMKPSVVFVTCSDTDRSLDVIGNLFFTQALNELTLFADSQSTGELPIPVMFMMDDFATNVVIDDFQNSIATIRSRNISTVMMIQSESQLQQCYGTNGAKTIIANCDTFVYMGGNDIETAHEVSIRADRPLSQILNMPSTQCWIFRRGEKPHQCEKHTAYIKHMEELTQNVRQRIAEVDEKEAI